MKSRIFDLLTRWRHTRGYGVHSPLAFRIVTECVCPDSRYAYYADSRIDYVFKDNRHRRRQLRVLVRLIVILRPALLWMPGADRHIANVVAEAFPSLRISTRTAAPDRFDLAAVFTLSDSSLPERAARSFSGSGESAILCFHNGDGASAPDIPGATLTLRGRRYSLSVKRTGMHPVTYDML